MLGTVVSFGETAVKEIQKILCSCVCVREREREAGREREGKMKRENRHVLNTDSVLLIYLDISGTFFFFFQPCRVACRILVSWPGIKLASPTVEIWSPNHWTAREFPSGTLPPTLNLYPKWPAFSSSFPSIFLCISPACHIGFSHLPHLIIQSPLILLITGSSDQAPTCPALSLSDCSENR